MEDGLGAAAKKLIANLPSGLNPCFSGGWSRRYLYKTKWQLLKEVLILVLVEDGLGGNISIFSAIENTVLILVLVEDGLGACMIKAINPTKDGLNPCFSGGWSRSLKIL